MYYYFKKINEFDSELSSIYINNNNLRKLPKFSNKILLLECCNNKLTKLNKLNYKLLRLVCSNNRLKKISLNFYYIYYFEIYNNKIIYKTKNKMKFNDKRFIYCFYININISKNQLIFF